MPNLLHDGHQKRPIDLIDYNGVCHFTKKISAACCAFFSVFLHGICDGDSSHSLQRKCEPGLTFIRSMHFKETCHLYMFSVLDFSQKQSCFFRFLSAPCDRQYKQYVLVIISYIYGHFILSPSILAYNRSALVSMWVCSV